MTKPKLGAGLGAFMRGYAAGGYVGGALGAAVGSVGGILGSRKQRSDAHQRAAEEWERLRPAYERFDASLEGRDGSGLREDFERLTAELKRYGVLTG